MMKQSLLEEPSAAEHRGHTPTAGTQDHMHAVDLSFSEIKVHPCVLFESLLIRPQTDKIQYLSIPNPFSSKR